MKDYLFSVIMPIYNVEPFLEKAIDSVLSQTYKNVEIILVDDASPDGCPAICDTYAEKYDNITAVHHPKNKGLSGARNTGLQYVRGDYVTFMDSDDSIEADLFQSVYDSLSENEADVIVFGCTEDYYNSRGELTESFVLKPEKAFCKTPEAVHDRVLELEVGSFYGYAWNKFYRTELIQKNNLTYRNVVLIEDIDFNIRFFDHVKSLNVLEAGPYHYAKRGTTSITSKFVPEYYTVHRERISLLCEQQKNWNHFGDYEKSVLARLYARYILSALSRNCDKRANMNHSERKQWLQSVFADDLFLELMPSAQPNGAAMGVLLRILQRKSVFLCLAAGRVIYLVQNKMKPVFVKLKQKR